MSDSHAPTYNSPLTSRIRKSTQAPRRAMWEPHTMPNKSMSRADHPSTGNNFIQALKEMKMLQS